MELLCLLCSYLLLLTVASFSTIIDSFSMWPGRWLQELQPTSSIQILTQEEDIFSPRVFVSKFMDRLFLVLLRCLLFGPIVEDVGMECHNRLGLYHTSRSGPQDGQSYRKHADGERGQFLQEKKDLGRQDQQVSNKVSPVTLNNSSTGHVGQGFPFSLLGHSGWPKVK